MGPLARATNYLQPTRKVKLDNSMAKRCRLSGIFHLIDRVLDPERPALRQPCHHQLHLFRQAGAAKVVGDGLPQLPPHPPGFQVQIILTRVVAMIPYYNGGILN